ncbi:hypothetical protein AWB92_16810 [Mycobacterium sp. IEC1808]|nr:hypothetical protein AWB92_16810 [Mycobacterium sp. IEC1808]
MEITITRGIGLALCDAVIARSRVPTRRKVSAATIARVYVGAFPVKLRLEILPTDLRVDC